MTEHSKEKTQIETLENEIVRLKRELEKKELQEKYIKKGVSKSVQKVAGLWVGTELKEDFRKVYNNPTSKDNLADLSGSLIKRFTRVGFIAIFFGLLPTFFLTMQTIILSKQNRKFDIQNDLLTKQNIKIQNQVLLEEASRRNNLVLLMDNILESVSIELSNKKDNPNDTLTTPLLGRIKALALGFQPYKFLETDSTLTPMSYSPERGQLLLALVNSSIDTKFHETLIKIYRSTTFSQAYLSEADLESSYLLMANLNKSNLRDANLYFANLRGTNLVKANLRGANLGIADLGAPDSREIELFARTQFLKGRGVQLRGAKLSQADLSGADLGGANLRRTDLYEANLTGADLMWAKVHTP